MGEDEFLTAAADLRVLLDDIPKWRLLTENWLQCQDVLRGARSALGDADAPRLQDVVAGLELLSPRLVQSRPGPQPQPTPAPEEVNVLVHQIELELGDLRRPGPSGGSPGGGGDRH